MLLHLCIQLGIRRFVISNRRIRRVKQGKKLVNQLRRQFLTGRFIAQRQIAHTLICKDFLPSCKDCHHFIRSVCIHRRHVFANKRIHIKRRIPHEFRGNVCVETHKRGVRAVLLALLLYVYEFVAVFAQIREDCRIEIRPIVEAEVISKEVTVQPRPCGAAVVLCKFTPRLHECKHLCITIREAACTLRVRRGIVCRLREVHFTCRYERCDLRRNVRHLGRSRQRLLICEEHILKITRIRGIAFHPRVNNLSYVVQEDDNRRRQRAVLRNYCITCVTRTHQIVILQAEYYAIVPRVCNRRVFLKRSLNTFCTKLYHLIIAGSVAMRRVAKLCRYAITGFFPSRVVRIEFGIRAVIQVLRQVVQAVVTLIRQAFIFRIDNGKQVTPIVVGRSKSIRVMVLVCKDKLTCLRTHVDCRVIHLIVGGKLNRGQARIQCIAILIIHFKAEQFAKQIVYTVQNARFAAAYQVDCAIQRLEIEAVFLQAGKAQACRLVKDCVAKGNIRGVRIVSNHAIVGDYRKSNARSLFEEFNEFVRRSVHIRRRILGFHDGEHTCTVIQQPSGVLAVVDNHVIYRVFAVCRGHALCNVNAV